MKKNLITICLVLVLTSQCFATDDFTYEFSTRWLDKYVTPDGLNIHDEPVIQSSFTISHKSGWYFNLWHSGEAGSHFLDKENDYATETDYGVGKVFQAWGLDVDFSVTYWDLEEQFAGGGLDLFFTRLNLGKTFEIKQGQVLTPYFQVSNYLLTSSIDGDGWDFRAGFYHDIDLDKNLKVSSEIAVIYNDGYLLGDHGFLEKVGTNLSWKLGKNMTLILPSATLYFSFQDFKDRETELILGGGISYKF